MSLGTQKGLDATAATPKTDHPQPQQPSWNVSNQEMLAHIKQDRATVGQAPHPEAKPAIAQVVHPQPAQQHRPDTHPVVTQAQPHLEAQRHIAPTQPLHVARPDSSATPPRYSAGTDLSHQYGQTSRHPQQPEVTTTPTTQNGRHSVQPNYESNTVIPNHNNSNRHLYGGLAGGALLGAGAGYYANRDYGLNYNGSYGNTFGFSDPYSNLDAYNNYNNGDINGTPGYDQYGNPIAGQYVDGSQYLNDGSFNPGQFGPNPDSNIYGGTTYGGTPFDGGIASTPIFGGPVPFGDGYPPYGGYEPRPNIVTAIPALFANLLGGVIGGITNSNHRRYYNPDC